MRQNDAITGITRFGMSYSYSSVDCQPWLQHELGNLMQDECSVHGLESKNEVMCQPDFVIDISIFSFVRIW
jgi:hypothetical protein